MKNEGKINRYCESCSQHDSSSRSPSSRREYLKKSPYKAWKRARNETIDAVEKQIMEIDRGTDEE